MATSPAARDAGANAGALAKTAAGVLGGGGGGKHDLAQGGGSDVVRDPRGARRRCAPASPGSRRMRSGARLGIDVGRARIGVARCDAGGLLAVPVETVARSAEGDDDVRRILELAAEFEVIELVVGNPLSLSGATTPSTDDAIAFAERLRGGRRDRAAGR